MTRVFVYGTLTDPTRVASLLDRYELGLTVVLGGLHRVEGRYPTLAPGGECEGRFLETPEIDRLDAYEGIDLGLYTRVSVPVRGGDSAECYVGDPSRLDTDAEWPGAGSLEKRVKSYLDGHDVEIGHKE